MKKSNRFLLVLVLMYFSFFSTKGFSQCNLINMDNSYDGMTYEQFLDNVAVVYGVHSQLTKHEGVHIPEFDRLVEDMKNSLNNSGISFIELASRTGFLSRSGQARICAHALYPQLEKIYGVKLPKHKLLNIGEYCDKISLTTAIENVKNYIY